MKYEGKNPYDYTYASRRNVVYGNHGMVASSQQLASQAGLEIMKRGGNAMDSAIAMAIALTVVEPTSNGIGGDAFAILWSKKDGLVGLNGSGPSGSKANAEEMKNLGFQKMPDYGFKTVTVPGAPSAWITISEKYGKLPFETLFEPAIKYAEEGFVVSPVVADMWESEYESRKQYANDPAFADWFHTYCPNGRAPKAGEIFKNPVQAATLKELAETKCESFYRGKLAEKIVEFSEHNGGFLTKEDFIEYHAEWVDPISVNYRGYDIWEIPPNGHGIIALMTLNMLEGFSLEQKESVDTYHKSIEALKLAYTDGRKYVADLRHMSVTVEDLLSDDYAAKRRAIICDKAVMPEVGDPKKGGTVYLCAADEDGNMISFIQSNYQLFGSGLVVPETSIALHNRGKEFSLDPTHDNYLMPKKKPYHTIIPGFITKDGKPVGPFGVMGGYMQPQGHVQVIENMIDFGMNPQQAIDAPRWQWVGDKKILVEYNFPVETYQKLQEMGHEIKYSNNVGSFGRSQIILRQENGTLIGGTESRADGAVLGY